MDKNTKTLFVILAVAVFMVGAAFAFVPLYRMFCQMTGWDGTPNIYARPANENDRRNATVIVQFNADVDRALPWNFKPEQRRITTQIGVPALTAYEAKNLSAKPVTGTAVYNVSPEKAGRYFNKTQCFCFDRQTLQAGQRADFPVQFYIDPKFVDDPEMDDVKIITLSYTFYEADSAALEKALPK